jgi:lipopolysaccharide cholinephosphotransferase
MGTISSPEPYKMMSLACWGKSFHGVFVDIFPLDKVSSNVADRQRQAKKISKIKKLQYYKRAYNYSDKNVIKRLAKKMVSFLLFAFSRKRICQMLDKEMRKFENDPRSNLVCSMACPYSYETQTMPCEYFGNPVMMQFEGRMYYAPEKHHEYLSQVYGDYMTPPPKKQQVAQMEELEAIIFNV